MKDFNLFTFSLVVQDEYILLGFPILITQKICILEDMYVFIVSWLLLALFKLVIILSLSEIKGMCESVFICVCISYIYTSSHFKVSLYLFSPSLILFWIYFCVWQVCSVFFFLNFNNYVFLCIYSLNKNVTPEGHLSNFHEYMYTGKIDKTNCVLNFPDLIQTANAYYLN